MTTGDAGTKRADRCGTTAGYQRHRKNGEEPCAKCRRANTEYMRKYREDPAHRQYDRATNSARSRALWRLADLHPYQFQALLDEELRAP